MARARPEETQSGLDGFDRQLDRTASAIGVCQLGEDPGTVLGRPRKAVQHGCPLQELLRLREAALVLATGSHEIVHARDDRRVRDSVLIHDLPG